MPREKRKSRFGRNTKQEKQKQSKYDYVAARESIVKEVEAVMMEATTTHVLQNTRAQ
jgi:hypothetical protein